MQAQHPVHARGGEALRQGETGVPRPLAPPHGGTDGAEAHDHQRPCRGLGDGGYVILRSRKAGNSTADNAVNCLCLWWPVCRIGEPDGEHCAIWIIERVGVNRIEQTGKIYVGTC